MHQSAKRASPCMKTVPVYEKTVPLRAKLPSSVASLCVKLPPSVPSANYLSCLQWEDWADSRYVKERIWCYSNPCMW